MPIPAAIGNSTSAPRDAGEYVDIEAVLRIARRQWWVVGICALVALAVGLIYAYASVPSYTSKISVLIDKSNGAVVERLSTIDSVADDESSVLSQVEVLMSDTIALAVVDRLNLGENEIFLSPAGSPYRLAMHLIREAKQWVMGGQPSTREQRRRMAADRLVSDMNVERVAKTDVLQVRFTSLSADLSALIANTIGQEYLNDKLNAKYQATRHASDWLQDRITELRQKALESDLAVQKFRSANGLVETGSRLVADQQLTELNTALIAAQADAGKAQARLARIDEIIASGQVDAIVTDVFDNTIATDLRKKYLEAAKKQTELSARFGANHEQAVKQRSDMAEYRRLMFEELKRIAEGYKSDYRVAFARQTSLLESVLKTTGANAAANEKQVQLRELEREADTYKELYSSFLQRYQQAIQQQSFPVTEARVITAATAATDPSHPRKPLVLALALLIGMTAGAAVGAVREFRDRFVRTGEDVRDLLGLNLLGTAPLVTVSGEPGDRIWDYAVDHPLSAFAEALRSAKVAIDLLPTSRDHKVIGLVSCLPEEGKSIISANLAGLLASQDARTVLVDADLRNPTTTRALGNTTSRGLLEAITGKADPVSSLIDDEKSGLRFLQAGRRRRVSNSADLLSSPGMQSVLTRLGEEADYVILDLPPMALVVDARAASNRIDGFILVIEWGKTTRQMVRQILQAEPQIRSKCLGVVLNKVDQEKMKFYRSYGTPEYYHQKYSSHYHED